MLGCNGFWCIVNFGVMATCVQMKIGIYEAVGGEVDESTYERLEVL